MVLLFELDTLHSSYQFNTVDTNSQHIVHINVATVYKPLIHYSMAWYVIFQNIENV